MGNALPICRTLAAFAARLSAQRWDDHRVPYRPTYRGFLKMCKALGYPLAPHQRKIARAMFGPEREVGASLPRGCAKSTTAALVALHHILSVEAASVYIGAGSMDQARIIGEVVRRYARHPAVRKLLVIRHDELRLERLGPTVLQVVASDGARAFGWERPTLMIGDECWCWADPSPSLLEAMPTALVKSPPAKLLLISTSPSTLDTPLGRVRERALSSPQVVRKGSHIDARGNGLRWLEWSVPDDVEATPEAVKKATPAPWITLRMLREQRPRVADLAWLQYHANRAHVTSARWLPVGAWSACRADFEVGEDEPLTLGVDVGGSRSTTALVGCVADEQGVRVALVEVRTGKPAVLDLVASIYELVAQGRPIRAIAFDPMRFEAEAIRIERDLGITTISWPQSLTRMTICSERLHALIVEGRLRHAGHPTLDAHIANAIAQPTPRGWRLTKSGESAHINSAIALAIAAECAEKVPAPARFLGWG
jgi:phage terminase large subunit-like protein